MNALTAGTDDLVGTGLNDVFNAPLSQVQDGSGLSEFQTLTDTDILDGGAGIDVLNATLIDGFQTTPEQIENIENIFLTSRAQSNGLDVRNVIGAEQVWNNNSTQFLGVYQLQNEVTLGVIEGNGSDYEATYNANAETAAGFTQNVVLQDADIDTLTVNDNTSNLTGLAINVTGTDAELDLAGDLPDISDLTVGGDAGLDISNTPLDDLETIDSTTTGDVSVVADDALEIASFGEGDDMLMAGGNVVESISTGDGDDSVMLANTLANEAEVDLGAGDDLLALENFDPTRSAMLDGGDDIDTLKLDDQNASALSVNDDFNDSFMNFEKIEVTVVEDGDVAFLDMDNLDSIDHVISNGTEAGTVNAPAEPEEHEFTVTSGADSDGGSFFLNGVEITVAGGASASDVAADITAAFDNGDFAGVPEIDTITNTGATVTVTYTETAGNVADDFLEFEENPASSAVTFSSNLIDAAGTAPVQEVQSFDVTAGTDADGGDVDITVDGGSAVTVALQGNLTQSEVASALATGFSGVTDVTATATGTTVTITHDASLGDVDLATFAASNSGAAIGTVAEDTEGVAPVDATQTFDIDTGTDADGGNILVGGVSIALGANLSIDQVGVAITDAFINGDFAGTDITDVAYDIATDEVTLTLDAANASYNVGLGVSDDPATSTVDLDLGSVAVTQFVPEDADPASVLVVDNLASGGTLEITGQNAGFIDVLVTDAFQPGSDSDVLNILLNDADALSTSGSKVGAGFVFAEDVETVNIETDNSGDDAPTDNTRIDLIAPDAETVTVSGNHGFEMFGSFLEDMTLFDGSGVVAVDSAPGADDAGDIGRIAIDDMADDADVTILTGNGDDLIDAFVVGLGTTEEVGATIDAGAGDDSIFGSEGDDMITAGGGDDVVNSSAGEDTITLGAGNDTYVLDDTQDSVINARDVIADFSANTVGQGTGGAATDAGAVASVEDRDGDLIDLSAFAGNSNSVDPLSVEVFANASDATTFLANNDGDNEMNIALDSSTGFLYIDTDDSGIANSVIELTGVSTIDEAAVFI